MATSSQKRDAGVLQQGAFYRQSAVQSHIPHRSGPWAFSPRCTPRTSQQHSTPFRLLTVKQQHLQIKDFLLCFSRRSRAVGFRRTYFIRTTMSSTKRDKPLPALLCWSPTQVQSGTATLVPLLQLPQNIPMSACSTKPHKQGSTLLFRTVTTQCPKTGH